MSSSFSSGVDSDASGPAGGTDSIIYKKKPRHADRHSHTLARDFSKRHKLGKVSRGPADPPHLRLGEKGRARSTADCWPRHPRRAHGRGAPPSRAGPGRAAIVAARPSPQVSHPTSVAPSLLAPDSPPQAPRLSLQACRPRCARAPPQAEPATHLRPWVSHLPKGPPDKTSAAAVPAASPPAVTRPHVRAKQRTLPSRRRRGREAR